jgi:hypothetical protein
MGGVSSRLIGLGVREDMCGLDVLPRVLWVWLRWLLERIRLNERAGHAMAWFDNGLAIMLVPGVASGGGAGLSDRKRGWMCASLTAGLGGRDISGIIFGG